MLAFQHASILLDIIIAEYFFNSRCLYLFIDNENQNSFFSKPVIPLVNIKISKSNNFFDKKNVFRHFGCQEIVIWAENASEILTKFEESIKIERERYNKRKYIVFTYNLTRILQNKALKHISDLLIIKLNSHKKYFKLFTHFPNKTKKLLDVWFSKNLSFVYKNNLFPDKLTNQNGRKLVIGTFNYEPYSIVDQKSKSFDGTETSFILEFVKKYNITPSFNIIGDDLWGEIYENWTGIGLLGSLVEDTVDLGYAALYSWDTYYDYLDYTKPLTRTGVTAIVPAPKLANRLLTPLLSFSQTTWILIVVSFVLNTFLLFLLLKKQNSSKNKENFHISIMSMTKILLLQSLTLPLTGRMTKYFFALNLVYVLLITTSYSSGLSSIMTVPRYQAAIKTVQDLAESGLNWGAPTDAWLISLKDVNQTDYVKIKNQFVVYPEEQLAKIAKTNNFGFSLERLPYGHYAIGSYVHRDDISNYRIMQEDIYWEMCIFMTRKNSILLPLLDKMLLRVFEAGLEHYWENRIVFNYMDMSVQRGIRFYTHHLDEQAVVKLKWVHVEGAFALLLIGYLTAVVAFIYEIFCNCRMQHTKN